MNTFIKILGLIFAVSIVSCTNKSNNSPAPAPEVVTELPSDTTWDISNLAVGDISLLPDTVSSLTFDSSASIKEVSKVVTIKNNGSIAAPLTLSFGAESSAFKLKVNRCPVSLEAGKSCQVTISFSNRGLFDGNEPGSLIVNGISGTPLLLLGTVSGNPNPDTSGTPNLVVTLLKSFKESDPYLYRELKIENTGTGTAKNVSLSFTNNDAYFIRLDRCPTNLKPQESCIMQVSQKGRDPVEILSRGFKVSQDIGGVPTVAATVDSNSGNTYVPKTLWTSVLNGDKNEVDIAADQEHSFNVGSVFSSNGVVSTYVGNRNPDDYEGLIGRSIWKMTKSFSLYLRKNASPYGNNVDLFVKDLEEIQVPDEQNKYLNSGDVQTPGLKNAAGHPIKITVYDSGKTPKPGIGVQIRDYAYSKDAPVIVENVVGSQTQVSYRDIQENVSQLNFSYNPATSTMVEKDENNFIRSSIKSTGDMNIIFRLADGLTAGSSKDAIEQKPIVALSPERTKLVNFRLRLPVGNSYFGGKHAYIQLSQLASRNSSQIVEQFPSTVPADCENISKYDIQVTRNEVAKSRSNTDKLCQPTAGLVLYSINNASTLNTFANRTTSPTTRTNVSLASANGKIYISDGKVTGQASAQVAPLNLDINIGSSCNYKIYNGGLADGSILNTGCSAAIGSDNNMIIIPIYSMIGDTNQYPAPFDAGSTQAFFGQFKKATVLVDTASQRGQRVKFRCEWEGYANNQYQQFFALRVADRIDGQVPHTSNIFTQTILATDPNFAKGSCGSMVVASSAALPVCDPSRSKQTAFVKADPGFSASNKVAACQLDGSTWGWKSCDQNDSNCLFSLNEGNYCDVNSTAQEKANCAGAFVLTFSTQTANASLGL